ncbi:MAG TPA: hypothetical protein VGK77_01890 [Candidatus Binatia bacterium]
MIAKSTFPMPSMSLAAPRVSVVKPRLGDEEQVPVVPARDSRRTTGNRGPEERAG